VEAKRFFEGVFSNSVGVKMNEYAFLLGVLQINLYWFDAEGVKKTKKREARWGRESGVGGRESRTGDRVIR
jgi:hypothetical protein